MSALEVVIEVIGFVAVWFDGFYQEFGNVILLMT